MDSVEKIFLKDMEKVARVSDANTAFARPSCLDDDPDQIEEKADYIETSILKGITDVIDRARLMQRPGFAEAAVQAQQTALKLVSRLRESAAFLRDAERRVAKSRPTRRAARVVRARAPRRSGARRRRHVVRTAAKSRTGDSGDGDGPAPEVALARRAS